MNDAHKGIVAMIGACCIWGLSPIYYSLVDHVPALEVLAYRTLWSCAFFAGVLFLRGHLSRLWEALSQPRRAGVILAAGLFIGTNWFGFIFSVHNGHVVESSLGYYMFPLVSVALGRIFYGEALSRAQWLAVAIAGVAVATLTAGLGVPPWISLLLAFTFGGYGVLKKGLDVGPVVSVTGEVLLLSPLAILWIAFMGTGAGGGNDFSTHALLAISGPLTGTPLILFSYAARRARLSTVGLIQYLNPTLQFTCATLVFAEPFTPWHGIAFPMIWVALAIYSGSALLRERASRRRASSDGTSGAVRT